MGVTVPLVLSTKSGFFCTFPDSRGLEQPPCTAPGKLQYVSMLRPVRGSDTAT